MKQLVISLILAIACASGHVYAAGKYPSDKELREIRDLCGGGSISSSQKRKVSSALKKWRNEYETQDDTSAASKDLAAILDKVTASAEGEGLYAEYVKCVGKQVDELLKRENAPPEPPQFVPRQRVETFFTAGATYGSIRTTSERLLTNDNQVIWLARVGWRFNHHVAFGLEASYWQATAATADGSGVTLDDPLRHTSSSMTLPLYLQVSDRFPLVFYFGAGMGWESHENLALDATAAGSNRFETRDSGLALVAGVGYEFPLSENTSLTVLARGIRTSIDSPSTLPVGTRSREPHRTILSVGMALSLN